MSLYSLSVSDLQARLRAGECSPLEAVDALEARITEVDGSVGGYLSRQLESAREQAARADVTLPLGGVPIAIKDNINVKGESLTCSSKILEGYVAPYDATVITRLRAAGAIPFGRTNLDEFAMGSTTESSAYGKTHNPWDTSRIPGGSSGGSAAVVAADEAFASLGSDTGGSIRQPAALCGCVGLKPSYGRVSRYGLVAFASSLDQIGPLTKNVRDAGLILNALAGPDPHDSTSLDQPVPDFTARLGEDLKGVRLGVPKEYFVAGIDPQVEQAVRAAIAQYESLGAEIVEVSMPHTEYAVSVYYVIANAEASANLARFDGVRYGRRAEGAQNILDQYARTREEGFGQEVKRRIILGTYVLSSGYYDAYYLKAQKVRTLIRRDFDAAFEKVDALICPTTPDLAFRLGECSDDLLKMYLADVFTIAVNLSGTCALSLPCGAVETQGVKLPVGMQLIGKPFQEQELLKIAHAYEQSTSWHLARAIA
ncbi:MAG TPA: Asp-tRNA(Asn)/Glu-tRNA(Gln) amidotransferase subunit GatA [Chthoniobacteraceae bacterium]|nr:Asp-tRNA(Asn)/Glu-tRNA(Gln) amidotransferase subunit GatA [Chthoniobacteraceae bacterium]